MLIGILAVILVMVGLLLLSLRFTRNVLHPAERIVNWLMSAAVSTHWYIVITLTWKLIEYNKELPVLFILVLNRIFLIPSLTVWVIYGWFHRKWTIPQKAVVTAWWFLPVFGAEYLLHTLGLTEYHR